MQIILCDDNVQILKQLQTYITEFFCSYGASPELVTYTSGEELLQNVDCADIAFLDVETGRYQWYLCRHRIKTQKSIH